jgi:hypothetical protein
MSATIEIREFPKGLTIRVTESRRVGRILLTLAAGSVFMYFLVHASSSSKLFLIFIGGLCLLSLVRDIISALRGTDVELRVTNLDFISMGHAPGDYKPSTISRADIYNLEFREATGGGDFPDLPQGLYVEHHGGGPWNPSTCVLPNIDRAQTEQVIESIYRSFPDTGTLPPSGPFEPYLTSLNLSQPGRG